MTDHDHPHLWDHPDIGDWQQEVHNGDTLRSFREWLTWRSECRAADGEPDSEPPAREFVIRASLYGHVDRSEIDDQALAEATEAFADHYTSNAYFETVLTSWEPA